MPEYDDQYRLRMKQRTQLITGIAGVVISVLLLIAGTISIMDPYREIRNMKPQSISGVISALPEQHSHGRGEYVSLRMQEYAGYSFIITGIALKARSQGIVGNLGIGDSVLLQADEENFNKLFGPKSEQETDVDIVTLRTRKDVFISWADYQRAYVADNRIGIFIAALGLLLYIYYMRQLHLYSLARKQP